MIPFTRKHWRAKTRKLRKQMKGVVKKEETLLEEIQGFDRRLELQDASLGRGAHNYQHDQTDASFY